MTQEDKELLLTDLSARSPYGLICSIYRIDDCGVGWRDETLSGYFYDGTAYEFYFGEIPISIDNCVSKIKPYLRPLSSMTEEEKKEIEKITNKGFYVNSNYIANYKSRTSGIWYGNWYDSYNWPVTNVECNKLISWLDKKHFDHRTDEEGKTLIEKGLALEAPEGMYNKTEKYEKNR